MSPITPYNNVEEKKEFKTETLKDLIESLHQIFESEHVNIEQVEKLMASYQTNPIEWRKFAKFDQYRYTRNLVDEGNGKFNLMILCWGEGHGSAIHDHADAHCFMKILHGSLSEVRFEWPDNESDEGLRETGRNTIIENDVCYINDSLGLHRVENPSHTMPAVSLHLYSPPFNSCSMFDQRTGHRTKCQVTFWSKYGERTPYEVVAKIQPEDN